MVYLFASRQGMRINGATVPEFALTRTLLRPHTAKKHNIMEIELRARRFSGSHKERTLISASEIFSSQSCCGPERNAMNVLICTMYNYKRTRKLIAFIHELLVLEPEMGTRCSSSAEKSSCFFHQAETKKWKVFPAL